MKSGKLNFVGELVGKEGFIEGEECYNGQLVEELVVDMKRLAQDQGHWRVTANQPRGW